MFPARPVVSCQAGPNMNKHETCQTCQSRIAMKLHQIFFRNALLLRSFQGVPYISESNISTNKRESARKTTMKDLLLYSWLHKIQLHRVTSATSNWLT